ncbi:hypothetical protein [Paenibacillus sp. SYP-B3998]|uniref:hypothetical protein n=1 Tax=Paenibacillus sp. SYP-B3998 TaxID=2678564 RepID=UPI0019688C39|nr:hypothetical protein [Paenibacillus sp. SYP-B3998]
MNNKSSLIAFLLSFLPGVGHLYMHRMFGAIVYGGGFFGSLFLIFVGLVTRAYHGEPLTLLAFIAALTWIINMIDMIIFLLRYQPYPAPGMMPYGSEQPHWEANHYATVQLNRNERTRIMLLSFIPGLGHYQLGLMQRGLTAMVTFFGVIILVFFVSIMTHNASFMAFLLAIPVLWFYTMFDALRQQQRKQEGFELVDRSMFDDFHVGDEYGRKNRTLATIIAIFPGAAHLYLSMTKRGVQLMAIFLFSIYILDVLRLSLFLFLLPILWFFSFFDALQQITKYENGTIVDKPIIENLSSYHRIIGGILIILGGYYVFKEIVVQFLYRLFPQSSNYVYLINNFGQTAIVALILIGAGIRLFFYHKKQEIPSLLYTSNSFDTDEKKNP